MRLVIDGDACPAKQAILKLAKKHVVEVILITSIAHYSDYPDCTYIVVDNQPEAVDMAIMNQVKKGDVVITGDYGLAAMVMPKVDWVLSPRGRVYNEGNIDQLLLQRHLVKKEIRSGGRVKGPAQYTGSDQQRLLDILERIFRRNN